MLSISVVARSNAILKQLVLQAKKEYEAEAVHRIQIYFADAHGSWRWTDSRHKRPLSSIVLNPGVKEMLVEDARDFLKSEKWYADRGIPFRRGYLLHGVPGSGKSSLIHALAGQLQLDIYVVSLSASWISDNTLTALMGRVPARCVLLLEDLDAAFVRSTNREDDNLDDGPGDNQHGGGSGVDQFPGFGSGMGSGGGMRSGRRRYGRSDGLSDVNTLSLSGLLNALDGVAASEGRLLFATTNHLERLDPALSRPGRMDVWVEFKNASKWQAEALFRNFFPCEEEEDVADADLEGLDIDGNVQVQDRDGKVRAFVPSAAAAAVDQRAKTPVDPRTHGTNGSSKTENGAQQQQPSLWSLSTSIASSASSLLSGSLPSSALASGATSPTLASPHPSMSPPLPRTFSGSPIPGRESESAAVSSATTAVSTSSATTAVSTSSATTAVSTSDAPSAVQLDKDQFGATNTAYLPPPPDAALAKVKPLDRKTLAVLAKRFADGLPEDEFSVAGLQGYLLKHKAQPEAAANGVEAWVQGEREMRERLKREKEAREVREKAQREKRRKEAQEKEKLKKAQDKKDQELEKVKKLLAEKEKEEELEKMRQQLKEKEEERRKKRKEKERKKKGKGKGKEKEKEKDEKESGSDEEEGKEEKDKKGDDDEKKGEKEKDKKKKKKVVKKENDDDDDKKEKKEKVKVEKKDSDSGSGSDSASDGESDNEDKDSEDERKKPEADDEEVLSSSSSSSSGDEYQVPPPPPASKWLGPAIPESDGWSSWSPDS